MHGKKARRNSGCRCVTTTRQRSRYITIWDLVERARRTTYHIKTVAPLPLTFQLARNDTSTKIITLQPNSHDWPLQHEWLLQAHPEELRWYAHWDWDVLAPGIWRWLYRAFIEYEIRQWAVVENGALVATVSWVPTARASNILWVAARSDVDATGLGSALQMARRDLIRYHGLTIEHPAGEMVKAFEIAGSRTIPHIDLDACRRDPLILFSY